MQIHLPEILFLILLAIILPVVFVLVQRSTKKQQALVKLQLDTNGFVVENVVMAKSHHHMTRIWQLLEQPTPYYVHISSLDTIASVAGSLGIADLKVGHDRFDREFFVRSNNDAVVGEFLTLESQEEFLSWKSIRFRTGSITNLLGADYLPDIKKDRDLRRVWMIDVIGKLDENQIKQLKLFGFKLRDKVIVLSAKWYGKKELKSKFFEGR